MERGIGVCWQTCVGMHFLVQRERAVPYKTFLTHLYGGEGQTPIPPPQKPLEGVPLNELVYNVNKTHFSDLTNHSV